VKIKVRFHMSVGYDLKGIKTERMDNLLKLKKVNIVIVRLLY